MAARRFPAAQRRLVLHVAPKFLLMAFAMVSIPGSGFYFYGLMMVDAGTWPPNSGPRLSVTQPAGFHKSKMNVHPRPR